MIRRIATLIGYTKAPKATFMLKHPVAGARALVAAKGLKALFTTRAGAVLGAMVAIPVALVTLGRGHLGEGGSA